jgi:hypothetical protein
LFKDAKYKDDIKIHQVAYVHMRWTCSQCEGNEIIDCHVCKTKSTSRFAKGWSWYDCEDPMVAFIDFIATQFDSRFNTILYAHFGSRFDAHFVLRTFYKLKYVPDLTMIGQKIFEINIKINKARFFFGILI